MPMKQIAKTAEIIARLKAAFGPDADIEDLAVFEATALNSLPIRQKHPLMEGAVAQQSMLQDLVTAINTESAPLQIMHKGGVLPAGRVFDARMNGNEARALFAMSQKTDAELISKIDSGIIDQVSVNLLAKRILCSKCNWDFRGPAATFENIYTATCANDHELRVDGVHAKLDGVEYLSEISLVNSGGAQGARIVGQSQSIYSAEPLQRLAASGHVPQLLLANITPTLEEDMNVADFTTQLSAAVSAKTVAEGQITVLTGERDTLNTKVGELTTQLGAVTSQVTTLTGERDAATAQVTTLTAEVEAGKTAVAAAVTALKAEATTILTACGKAAEVANLSEDPNALLAVIAEHRAQFAAAVPVGGAAAGADTETKLAARPRGAFTTRR